MKWGYDSICKSNPFKIFVFIEQMSNFSQARTNMVDGQIHPSGVVNLDILNVFGKVPRELFVPEKLQNVAYTDEEMDIGQGRFLLEPKTHAKMIQAIEPTKSDVVLDIGVGSGYSSAILSPLVLTVIALENNKRQIDKAERLWKSLEICNVALMEGDLEGGVPQQAPYSLIIINGAVHHVPTAILGQLEVGGRLISVVRKNPQTTGQVTLFMKSEGGGISETALFDASAPYLKGFEPKSEFCF